MDEPRILKCDAYVTSTIPPAELLVRTGVNPAAVLRADLLQLLGDLQFNGSRDLMFGREPDSKALIEVLGQEYHLA